MSQLPLYWIVWGYYQLIFLLYFAKVNTLKEYGLSLQPVRHRIIFLLNQRRTESYFWHQGWRGDCPLELLQALDLSRMKKKINNIWCFGKRSKDTRSPEMCYFIWGGEGIWYHLSVSILLLPLSLISAKQKRTHYVFLRFPNDIFNCFILPQKYENVQKSPTQSPTRVATNLLAHFWYEIFLNYEFTEINYKEK